MKLFKKINKLFLIVIMAALCTSFGKNSIQEVNAAASSTYRGKVQEVRAVWVSHFAGDVHAYSDEESYKAEILGILNNMEKMGFNTIIFHVRTHNNALYKSELNPVASFWSKVNFDEFDPLEWMIDECHSRGIEFHAWLNPYRVSTNGTTKHYVGGTIPEGNPVLDESNLLQVGDSIIFDPGIPEVRDYIVDSCMEVVENYDVDAIHFDDYFYISGCDDAHTRNKYNIEGLSLGDFRRKQVDLFIEKLSDKMYEYNIENNKTVQLGISPSGIYRNGSYSTNTPQYDENGNLTYPLYSNTSGFAHYDNYLYSDTKKWIDEEWIDYILPQTYWAIGHTSASYAELAKWWSWTVEHKKVNLYLGVGIYMSLENTSSGQYWKSPNEVKNQIETANRYYDNIQGLSFYKYSSMLNTGSLMQGYVNSLEDYWIKDVPGSVQLRYTHLPEPDVTNLTLAGTKLSWDKVDNVRGYIVWQTKRNDEVNRVDPDINQLYIYTQDTQVEIVDGYDYYVSTVNLANEISEPISVKEENKVERVINLINSINIPVTLDQASLINNVKAKFDALTKEEQSKVNNASILEFALEQIQLLNLIKKDEANFVNTLVKDTTSKYVLPTSYLDYSVTWEYVNENDSKLYNIKTGEVLVEYLATTLVGLKYTLSKNGLSVSGTFNLNIGYVKQSEIGLIYRNTPNSLNPLEDPSANVSFIGWSGKVFKFNNYVFFIADKNYHELTSSDIPKGDWSSCGNVYVNKTNKTISAPVSSFSITTISNYGYFIIGADGLVRLTVATASSSDTITLAPGEILYSSNYLDGLITSSPLRPATGVPVGTKIELITPTWKEALTEQEQAQALVDEINQLPSNITLVHQSLVQSLIDRYESLSKPAQAYVTNYNLVEQAKAKIDKLIEEEATLNELKLQAIKDLKNYITDLTIYSDSGKTQIQNIIAMYEIQITNQLSITSVNELLTSAKTALDNVNTKAEEDAEIIQEERDLALKDLNSYIQDLSIYSQKGKDLIATIISNTTNAINNANTVDDVMNILEKGMLDLDEVLTEVEEYQNEGIDKIEELISNIDYTLYSSSNANKIRNAILSAKTNVLKSTNEAEITKIINDLDALIKDVKTKEQEAAELQIEKDAAIKVIYESYNIDDYANKDKPIVEAIVNEYVTLINLTTSQSKIVTYKAEALSKIKAIPIDELAVARRETKEQAREYIDALIVSEVGRNQLETLYSKLVENVENETIEAKITLLLKQFKDDADNISKNNPQTEEPSVNPPKDDDDSSNCKLFSVYSTSVLMSMLLGCILVLKKRR